MRFSYKHGGVIQQLVYGVKLFNMQRRRNVVLFDDLCLCPAKERALLVGSFVFVLQISGIPATVSGRALDSGRKAPWFGSADERLFLH